MTGTRNGPGYQASLIEQDALREIANIGAGHAATALSDMTNGAVAMAVPSVSVEPLAYAGQPVPDSEEPVAAVYVRVPGAAQGHALLMLSFADGLELAGILLGSACASYDELTCSALAEAGNILISSFLNAVAEATGLTLAAAPPQLAIDMAGAVIQSVIAAADELPGNRILTVTTRLSLRGSKLNSLFWYLPDASALPTLFGALGING